MARPTRDAVFSHWSKLYENFHTSSEGFYSALEVGLERRKIPFASRKWVTWMEGGAFSASRTYLRVQRERMCFDICAAPFGSGFFFSWWLVEKPSLLAFVGVPLFLVFIWVARLLIGVGLPFLPAVGPMLLKMPGSILEYSIALLLCLWFSGLMAKNGSTILEDGVQAVPGLRWIYAKLFRPFTYYRVDTMLMFQSAVHSAVLEAIGTLTSDQSLKPLSSEEEKPILRALVEARL